MNGDTKNKFRGGIYGAAITALLSVTAFAFGYGILTNRVEALETKTNSIEEIHKDIASIKTDISWIKDKF